MQRFKIKNLKANLETLCSNISCLSPNTQRAPLLIRAYAEEHLQPEPAEAKARRREGLYLSWGPAVECQHPDAPSLAENSRRRNLASEAPADPELRAPGRRGVPCDFPRGWPRVGAPLRRLGVGRGSCSPSPEGPVRVTAGPVPCPLCFPFGSCVRSNTACKHGSH